MVVATIVQAASSAASIRVRRGDSPTLRSASAAGRSRRYEASCVRYRFRSTESSCDVGRRAVVLAVEHDAALGDFIVLVAAEHLAERAFARAVRAHDGVDFTGLHFKGEALEDFAVRDLGVEVLDIEAHFKSR